MRLALAALVAIVSWSAAPASGQNIVTNGDFQVDFTGPTPSWSTFTGDFPPGAPPGTGSAASWTSAQEATGNPNPGAAQVHLGTAGVSGEAFGISQCVLLPVAGPASARFGARFKVPAGQSPASSISAQVEVWFYSGSDCSAAGVLTGGQQGKLLSATDPSDSTWYTADVHTPHFDLGGAPGATRASVRVYVQRVVTAPSATPLTAYFDNVHLTLNDTTPVELQWMEVE